MMPKKDISFKSSYGEIRLLAPMGAAGNSYQVYINNYFQGMLFTRDGKWIQHFNEKCKLKPSDVEKIIEIIERSDD